MLRSRRRRLVPAALVLVGAVVLAGCIPVKPGPAPVGVYTGYGFDTCGAPSAGAMQSWLSSPYRSVGIYVGGANRACGDGNLSGAWVTAVTRQGWKLAPLYVGLQAPCVFQGGLAVMDAGNPAVQAVQSADDAVTRSQRFGLGSGTPIYFDLEAYNNGAQNCVNVVRTFITWWVAELHRLGYVAGLYSSAASGISDQVGVYGNPRYYMPDDIWYADWNGQANTAGDRWIPSWAWPNHQRLHQYSGGHNETWGGVTLNIDGNYDDGQVFG